MLCIKGWKNECYDFKEQTEIDGSIVSIALLEGLLIAVDKQGRPAFVREKSYEQSYCDWEKAISALSPIARIFTSEAFLLLEDSKQNWWTIGMEFLSSGVLCSPIPKHLPISTSVDKVSCGQGHALLIADGKCYALGKGTCGQLGLGPEVLFCEQPTEILFDQPSAISDISAGRLHSLIVTEPFGTVFSCGSASYGRLGMGDVHGNIFYPTRIIALDGVGTSLPNGCFKGISKVGCGMWHSIAVAEGTGDVFGWGWNNFGQLGPRSPGLTSRDELHTVPFRISALDAFLGDSTVGDVYCGSRFSCLHTEEGDLVHL